ncbi:MAG: aldehyde dehydrogenase family protein [Caulobacterales bacterium]
MNDLRVVRELAGRHLIGADWMRGAGKLINSIDPATGQPLAQIAAGGADEVDAAVHAARATFESATWSRMRPLDRGKLLENVARTIEDHADELALVESYDNGKPVHLAKMVDVPSAAEVFRYMGGWCSKLTGQTLAVSGTGATYHAYTRREPIGVVGAIVPWNYPLAMASWKIATALAAGCTLVLKPSEETSLSVLLLADLMLKAGVPAGALNIVTGTGAEAGNALVTHPDVDKVAFTGSTAVGKQIAASCATSLKRVSLELGGKSPNIIMADANLEEAIPAAAMSIFFNSGQVCFAGSRLFVQEQVHDAVVDGIAAMAKQLPIGDGRSASTMIGPLVNKRQQERVLSYIDSGISEGASVAAGGKAPAREGFFVEPTVLVNARPDMRVYREEIFGPVVSVMSFKDKEEAVRLANDTEYGLAANIWTRDLNAAHTMAARINAGTVWVNCYFVIDPAMPFGGFKQSGWGREVSEEGLLLYTETKSVCVALSN